MEGVPKLVSDAASRREVFKPQETLDNPFDVTLVVEDDKEFKAHRQVLAEASPFFEKLLNSDMIESKEGVARLEMLTEACLGDILEFIYTGSVQISTDDSARDLIKMADYLFIPQLRTIAGGVLAEKLDTSNCISTYYLAERYHCEELISVSRNLIFTNFTVVEKGEEFRNLPSEEVEKWISSDEIEVSAEEEVFKIILSWIDHNKSEREKYFAELFRQVRLVYVSRDYLSSDILTNHLVNNNECCLEPVKAAVKAIESRNSENLTFPSPRKSLETPVIAVSVQKEEEKLLCYVPGGNTWYSLRDTSPSSDQVVSCHGKLYFVSKRDKRLLCYDLFFDRWIPLAYNEKRDLQEVFVINQSEIYALESENEKSSCGCVLVKRPLRSCGMVDNGAESVAETLPCGIVSRGDSSTYYACGKQHLTYVTKYRPDLNSWEDISSFDLGFRKGFCIVTKGNHVYFIGGVIIREIRNKPLTDVDRYDLAKRKWVKLADLQEMRDRAYGTASQEKIFITGGSPRVSVSTTCEVYNETTNEWHFIASRRMPRRCGSMMCVDNKIYVIDGYVWSASGFRGRIECYEPDEDEWKEITDIPVVQSIYDWYLLNSCPVRVFKGRFLQWKQVNM